MARPPRPDRIAGARIDGVYYYRLSKFDRRPKDYRYEPLKDNSHLKDYYQRNTRYPWADWCNGAWWQINRGTDYTVETITMLRYLHVRGWRKGLRVNAYRMPTGDAIRFCFYIGTPRYLNLREHGVHWRTVRKNLI